MPPRIEPMRPAVPQPMPIQDFVRHAARAAARTAAAVPADAGTARAAEPRNVVATRASQRPPATPAPMMPRTIPREAGVPRPAPVQTADARPGAAARHAAGPAVEPIQQRLPERVVEMLNAHRGRQAVTAIARAARPAQNAATAQAAPGGAVAVPADAGTARQVTAAVAEPRVVVEPAAPAIRFAPAPAERPQFAAAAVVNEQVRQTAARQAFQTAVNTRTAEEDRPAGAPTRHRAIIDQRV